MHHGVTISESAKPLMFGPHHEPHPQPQHHQRESALALIYPHPQKTTSRHQTTQNGGPPQSPEYIPALPVRLDPQLVKWNKMTTNRHKHFRWTPRTAWLNIVYVIIVPVSLGVVTYNVADKWNMRGKRRGDLISEF
ncbi:hypothetical protein K504DRAFT_529746 [Pleomassaria siparia CBS 279.74]|uniref:Complex I-B15 n=1 Tax=Pleomassaria siparia CBS 279.74 TaxID=1314801 RepID=A0A6G1KRY9_9PLEO|nr:hypothetical protein K504DRAFT_529746 [Pleomassaria siparia CBS 279.74]